jgi:hypothetical protein
MIMMSKYRVTVRATSITVQPGLDAMDDLEQLLELLTYEDEFVEEVKTLGFLYDEEFDTLYLHKGIDLNYLKRCIPDSDFIDFPNHRYEEMKFDWEEIITPRNDEQRDVIDFMCGRGGHAENLGASQLFVVKAPGFG